MTTKLVEVKLSEEVHALVKKMAEAGRGKGRGERKPCTIGEMAADLVNTGVLRRIAANKWAKENAKPAKPRKPKAAKVVKLKTAKKGKGGKKGSKKKSAPASSSAAAPAAASVLD